MATGEERAQLKAHRDTRRVVHAADYREPAERGRDRVLYCSALRRLGSVTQVVAVGETLLLHNRLTHTLKVAQIARRLAQRIIRSTPEDHITAAGGLDPDVAEAAALAHDLGHPPFGHVAEATLQELLAEANLRDGFEGNAQSFRIVTKLAFRSMQANAPALNLTRASLRAILKYPWLKGQEPSTKYSNKWGAYDSERIDFDFAMAGNPEKIRGVEAPVMDWADDIAYAVHDVQDFYIAGLIPLDQLRNSPQEANRFIGAAAGWLGSKGWDGARCQQAFARMQGLLPISPYSGSIEDRAAMHGFASSLITRYVEGIQLRSDAEIHEPENLRYELEVLKQLTWFYVINRAPLATLQRGQRQLIRVLFQELGKWAAEAAQDPREEARLPVPFRELLIAVRNDPDAIAAYNGDDASLRTRAVVDYIASLTEAQAVKLHGRLTGSGEHESALEVWLRV